MRFYLGTHEESWLARVDVPLFVSHRRLQRKGWRKRARCRWALDSGGFTELDKFSGWRTTPADYASAVREYVEVIGGLDWAAPQDWMCEPSKIAQTGLTVRKHQERTVANYLELRALAPDLPFVPVLQGWRLGDYLSCIRMYEREGVDLAAQPLVGLGSVCRRQATGEILEIVATLSARGLRLHGFGVKTLGLGLYGRFLASADSTAWSLRARKVPPMPGCRHKTCSNCIRFAMRWRGEVVDGFRTTEAATAPSAQLGLDLPEAS